MDNLRYQHSSDTNQRLIKQQVSWDFLQYLTLLQQLLMLLTRAKQVLRTGFLRAAFSTAPPPAPKKIEMFINDEPYQVEPHLTIFQAAKENGIEIPRFCYHERLKIAGNCRMCLVEVAKSPKPVASCCSQVAPAMRVYTESEATRLARGGVMEFLLANHPLDCPICDQGGECDLQNFSHDYGYNASRYHEFKRAVQDKNFGPLIITHMNRCIHCTRCVRFYEEVAGFFDLGTTGRGKLTEIGTYVEKMMTSELSGNLADVCPVGALNNGPFAYTSRPYELDTKNSIDVLESMGSNVSIDYRGNKIHRVNPAVNEQINEEWLSDKSRHGFDGLKRKRLDVPLSRKGDTFYQKQWDEAFNEIADRLQNVEGHQIAGAIGQFSDVESIVAFKDFLNSFNSFNYEFRNRNNINLSPLFRGNYLFNSRIQGVQDADLILLVGVNIQYDAPLMSSRIMQSVRKGTTKVVVIGPPADYPYEYIHLGNDPAILNDIIEGKSKINEQLSNAKTPMMILGKDVITRKDSSIIVDKCKQLAIKSKFINSEIGWNGFNVLNRHAGQINALELGLDLTVKCANPKVIFLLGSDNNISKEDIPKDSFVVYIGTHGDEGAQYADIILPAAAYTEQSGTFANIEGRVQMAQTITEPPGLAREPWAILRGLSEVCGVTLPYDSLQELRHHLYTLAPHLLKYDHIEPTVFSKVGANINSHLNTQLQKSTPFVDNIDNYYMTDAVTRSSLVMAKCSVAFNPLKFSNFKKLKY